MVVTPLKEKRACPSCQEKTLITNDVEKFDDSMYHHCLNCGYEFSDNEQIRKFREDEKKDKKQNPWNTGVLVLAAMLVTIMAIELGRSDDLGTQVDTQPIRINLLRDQ